MSTGIVCSPCVTMSCHYALEVYLFFGTIYIYPSMFEFVRNDISHSPSEHLQEVFSSQLGQIFSVHSSFHPGHHCVHRRTRILKRKGEESHSRLHEMPVSQSNPQLLWLIRVSCSWCWNSFYLEPVIARFSVLSCFHRAATIDFRAGFLQVRFTNRPFILL